MGALVADSEVAREARGTDRPVVVVIPDSGPYEPLLDRAVAAAEALSAPIRLVLVHPRTGFSTDPALLAWTARQRRQRLDEAAAVVQRRSSTTVWADAESVPYARRPFRDRARQAWRAVESVAERCDARLVVAPQTLAEVATGDDGVLAVVGVPVDQSAPGPKRTGF